MRFDIPRNVFPAYQGLLYPLDMDAVTRCDARIQTFSQHATSRKGMRISARHQACEKFQTPRFAWMIPGLPVPGKLASPLSPSCYCKPSRGMSFTSKERSENDLSIHDNALLYATLFSHVRRWPPRSSACVASSSRSRKAAISSDVFLTVECVGFRRRTGSVCGILCRVCPYAVCTNVQQQRSTTMKSTPDAIYLVETGAWGGTCFQRCNNGATQGARPSASPWPLRRFYLLIRLFFFCSKLAGQTAWPMRVTSGGEMAAFASTIKHRHAPLVSANRHNEKSTLQPSS